MKLRNSSSSCKLLGVTPMRAYELSPPIRNFGKLNLGSIASARKKGGIKQVCLMPEIMAPHARHGCNPLSLNINPILDIPRC